MAIEILSGSPTDPTQISLDAMTSTFVVEATAGAIVAALLPGSNGGNAISARAGRVTGDLTIICLSADGLALFPMGDDAIYLADTTSGDGNGWPDPGCIVCSGAVSTVRLRAVTGGWAVVELTGVWEVRQAYSLAGPVRGSVRGAYQMMVIPAATMTGAGASAAAPAADARGLSFPTGSDADVPFQVVMPADWQLEGDLALHLTWCKTTSAAGAVKWQSRYRICKPGAGALTAYSAWADIDTHVAANGDTAERVAVARFADLDMASTDEGTVVIFDVRREGSSGSDTYAAAAVLIAAGVRYPADYGWRSVFAK